MNDSVVDLAYLRALSNLFEQCDGEFSTDVFFEFVETAEDFQAAIRALEVECAMPGGELQAIEQTENLSASLFAQQADLGGVAGIDCHTDCNGFAMVQPVSTERFEFMSGPMPEIQRPGAAGFERVARRRDVPKMDLSRVADQVSQCRGFKVRKG